MLTRSVVCLPSSTCSWVSYCKLGRMRVSSRLLWSLQLIRYTFTQRHRHLRGMQSGRETSRYAEREHNTHAQAHIRKQNRAYLKCVHIVLPIHARPSQFADMLMLMPAWPAHCSFSLLFSFPFPLAHATAAFVSFPLRTLCPRLVYISFSLLHIVCTHVSTLLWLLVLSHLLPCLSCVL